MFDSLTHSGDALLVLLYVVTILILFLFGPHKAYEAIFGALIGLGLYLFIYQTTFTYVDITKTYLFGQWMIDHRGMLLWSGKIATVALFLLSPMTLGLNVSGVVRGTFWFCFKVLVLGAFLVVFTTVLFSLLTTSSGLFGQVGLIPNSLLESPYFKNSWFFPMIADRSVLIVLGAFILTLYKVIFSQSIARLLLIGGAIAMKGNQIFGKKTFDATPVHHDEEEGHHEDAGHEHH